MKSFNHLSSAIRVASSPLFEFSVNGTNGVKIHREALSDRFPELAELFRMDQTDEDFEIVAESFGFDTKSNQFSWGTQRLDIFGLFIQFVYTGEYTDMEPVSIELEVGQPCDTTYGQLVSMREKTRTYLLEKYGRIFPHFYDQTSHQIVSPSPDNKAWDNYGAIFGRHSAVFHFAKKRNLGTLCSFAIYKVQQLLLRLICFDVMVHQVVKFLGYFLGQITKEDDDCDHMVTTVVHFAACYANRFWANLHFTELIGSNKYLCYMFIHAVVNGAPKNVEEQPSE
ncbi:hypothetical protein C2857_006213 [Epichloe festucae Fl1]|uniref:Uncharacterized protein n=1 Tax=Epichloe festucae (strain Fl1) TaxID=877507 RepID=A0A7S9PUB4_EPIFF|nr:hypothetical protein C2857_006213 [Epichloe festucae Fl1]